MKPRILLLSQEVHPIPPVKGAAVEQWIAEVARRLSKYEAHVISVPHPQRPDNEVEHGVHFHRIRVGKIYNRIFRKISRLDPWPYSRRILGWIKNVNPAVIHIHNAPGLVDAIAAGAGRAKIILHMHNEKSDPVCTRIDALVGCSAYIRDWFRDRRIDATQFNVLANGVDTRRFSPERRGSDSLLVRARHGIPPGRFVLLYAGRISPEKGPDLLVEAMRGLDGSKFHLVLAGEWPGGDPAKSDRADFAMSLSNAIQGLPITIIDSVSPDEMPRIYDLGDLLVVPSRFEEPFSMAAIEAMASGVPVLALRKGGMVEYMVDRHNAVLLGGSASAAQLADTIRALENNGALRAHIAGNARKLVEDRFTWEHVAAQTETLYEQLTRS